MRIHARVYGRVQGVYFRASTQRQATALGVVGWVRNRSDGSVELVAEGKPEQLSALLDWCHKGPPMARVDRVECNDTKPVGLEGGFDVRPSV